MRILNRIKRKLFPNKSGVLFYDDALRLSYLSSSLVSSQLEDKKALILSDGTPLGKEIGDRLAQEKVQVQLINIENNEEFEPIECDLLIIAYDWRPAEEMMRLKSISKDTYSSFIATYAYKSISIVKHTAGIGKPIKVISLLPAYAIERKFGFTLYGITAQYIISTIQTIESNNENVKYLNVICAKTLRAKAGDKANIISKEGSIGHILLREQVAAIISFLCSKEGSLISQSCLRVGVGDCKYMDAPIINNRITSNNYYSYCGGANRGSNCIIIGDEKKLAQSICIRFEEEGANCYYVNNSLPLNQELACVEKKMVGYVDCIINVINTSLPEDPIKYIYQWFQIEAPYLTSHNKPATICTVLQGTNYDDATKNRFVSLIESLALLLGNHSLVINGVFCGEDVEFEKAAVIATFLSSKYGEALTGETLILK